MRSQTAANEIQAEHARIRARHLRHLRWEPTQVLLDLASGRDLVSLRLGSRRIFIVNHPELVERVLVHDLASFRRGGSSQAYRLGGESLVTQEGAAHDRNRGLVEPLFAEKTVARYGTVVTGLAEELERRWADGAVRDIDADMTDHMLDVIGSALFGRDYREEATAIRSAFDASRKVIHRELVPVSVVLWTLPLPATRRYGNARAALRKAIDRMAAVRRAEGGDSDLLSLLVAAADEDGRGLTDGQIADEAWGYLAQGAPAHALTWCWWLLAAYPDIERRLHDELQQTVTGRAPTADDLPSLPLTRAIVLEALRLYPPVWGIDRIALENHRLGGESIPAGSTVFVSPYVTHRDERFWPNADAFEPDRWLGEAAPSIDDYTYLTFGAGQRRCVARIFVLMHCILTLATLARNWQPRPLSERLRVEAFPFLRPRGGLEVRLVRRERV